MAFGQVFVTILKWVEEWLSERQEVHSFLHTSLSTLYAGMPTDDISGVMCLSPKNVS